MCSAVISCQLLIGQWVLLSHPLITAHSFTKAAPFKYDLILTDPSSAHTLLPVTCLHHPSLHLLALSAYMVVVNDIQHEQMFLACYAHRGGSAHVPCFILACSLANPGNIQRMEPSVPSIAVSPLCYKRVNQDKMFLTELTIDPR